jgi:hypothetical protein
MCFRDPARLNVLGFTLTVLTLLAGLVASVTDSVALTALTLIAQLTAMLCFTLVSRRRPKSD